MEYDVCLYIYPEIYMQHTTNILHVIYIYIYTYIGTTKILHVIYIYIYIYIYTYIGKEFALY